MKKIKATDITESVKQLCMKTAVSLPDDVMDSYIRAYENETDPTGKEILDQIIKNARIGRAEKIPVCQDTGMAIFFVELGNNVLVEGMLLPEAINEGVRRGYEEGFLRKSVVRDPLDRINTMDNTPAVIYYDFKEGDDLKITLMQKGFGSENMSGIRMLNPSEGRKGITDFVVDVVKKAGPNPCPPLFIGVGIGGTMEMAGILSKKALLRKIGSRNTNKEYAQMESELLERINSLNIGPGGLGGKNTAVDVFIESYPTHIAGLPVGVTLCCHSLRHGEVIL